VLALAVAASAQDAFDHTHAAFDKILKANVRNGLVDYDGVKASAPALTAYIKTLGAVTEDQYSPWTINQKLAYWLNLYNACLLDAIVRNWPLKPDAAGNVSPRQIGGLWTNYKWNTIYGPANLHEIDFHYLRKFNAHSWQFGLQRGTKGGPPALAEAFVGPEVDRQLARVEDAWAADPANMKMDAESGQLHVSDFIRLHADDLRAFYFNRALLINQPTEQTVAAGFYVKHRPDDKAGVSAIERLMFSVVWMPYDETLNQAAPAAKAP